MKCYNCDSFCLLGFCEHCLEELSELSLGVRKLDEDFKVYYFYKYSEIKHLLYSKHKFYGYFILNALAKLSFAKFKDFFDFQSGEKITAIPLDDRVENSLYSHSALLARYVKSKNIKVQFHTLHAQNTLKYSGKSLSFRQKNKRNYKLLKPINSSVILIDDIITSGSSLLEAKKVLQNHKIRVLFALVLANAKE
ncbi:ComF family protein [Campylobacter sp. MIT 97-5078]|uniref:ComF family protein n=1 Tax=Campylobacter sp. MIT 97-5078 TaxID=1548153 RepID=UPI0005141BE1|nr:phosphoribosyltransferase family protein [Campylobacter sp. MIT 97-5078]KGI56731.1 phosphoribosyltransferase [Campylobacter sp. MIT 97-5078]KGI57202.1 phosphoribosyltransferase [Campylobacter sp. MIT 97-5078]TQR27588.1 ComF family protein [Campylobacter sp. MIT 97-5078]